MIALKKDDIYDESTLTFDLIKTLDTEEKALQELLTLAETRKDYLINFLRENEEVPLDVWNAMREAFDHSTLDADEIYDMGKKRLRNYFIRN